MKFNRLPLVGALLALSLTVFLGYNLQDLIVHAQAGNITVKVNSLAKPNDRTSRAEIRFLEGMSDHHQMALDMANDCVGKATSPDVLKICQHVIAAQTPEIAQMRQWLHDWYHIDYQVVPDSAAMPGMAGMNTSAMPNMPKSAPATDFTDPAGMMGMMAGFNRLTGKDYDLAWLESMIDHHDDALHMSSRLLQDVQTPELNTFAQNILTNQAGEITQMETLITALNKP